MPTVGRKADGKHTQSVVFEKEAGWTAASSKTWVKDNDYYSDGLDESENQLRWRQYDPEADKFRYRTQVIKEKDGKVSIFLVLGFPKSSSSSKRFEQRVIPVELRAVDGAEGKTIIQGHAAVFDQYSDDLGGFREIIRKGAFSKTIQESDVAALWNHDSSLVLGRKSNDTLKLTEDETGLAIEFEPPDTQWGRDAVTLIRRKDVYQMSFAFSTVKDKWISENNITTRELLEVKLYDISPVTYPAYPQTDVNVRGMVVDPFTEESTEPYEPGQGSHSDEKANAETARMQNILRRKRLDLMDVENK